MPQVIITYLFRANSFKRYLLLFSMTFFVVGYTNAQQNFKDSLESEILQVRNQDNFQPQDLVHINLLNELSNELRFFKPDSLLLLAQEALVNSILAKYSKGKFNALTCIGDYYSDRGMHKEGVSHYLKAQKIALELNNTAYILDTHNFLAGEYEYQGKYDSALEEYLEAMEIAKTTDNIEMLSILNENVAMLYASQKDYKQALQHFKIVKKLNNEINDEMFYAQSFSNIAHIHAEINDLEFAMYTINRGISIFEKLETMDWLAYAYEVKGKIYLKQKKYKWALFWYNQSKNLHDKTVDDERAEIDVLHGLAEANFGVGNDSLSEQYALKGFNLAQRLNIKVGIQKNTKILYQLHKQKEAYIEALAYHELYQELSDTIAKNEGKKSLIMLKTKLNHEQQKQDLIAENQIALDKQKNYIYASMAILLVLLAITLFVRRSANIQKRLNKELNIKKNAIEKSEHELKEINETKDKLFSIIGHDLRGPIGAFQGLLQLFRSGEISQSEFLTYIPKLGADIDHISFTLNNLLSWGANTNERGNYTAFNGLY